MSLTARAKKNFTEFTPRIGRDDVHKPCSMLHILKRLVRSWFSRQYRRFGFDGVGQKIGSERHNRLDCSSIAVPIRIVVAERDILKTGINPRIYIVRGTD